MTYIRDPVQAGFRFLRKILFVNQLFPKPKKRFISEWKHVQRNATWKSELQNNVFQIRSLSLLDPYRRKPCKNDPSPQKLN